MVSYALATPIVESCLSLALPARSHGSALVHTLGEGFVHHHNRPGPTAGNHGAKLLGRGREEGGGSRGRRYPGDRTIATPRCVVPSASGNRSSLPTHPSLAPKGDPVPSGRAMPGGTTGRPFFGAIVLESGGAGSSGVSAGLTFPYEKEAPGGGGSRCPISLCISPPSDADGIVYESGRGPAAGRVFIVHVHNYCAVYCSIRSRLYSRPLRLTCCDHGAGGENPRGPWTFA